MSTNIRLENQQSRPSSLSLGGPEADLFTASCARLNTVATTALSNLPPLPENPEEFSWVELPQSSSEIQDIEDALFSSPTLSLLDTDVEGISNFSSPCEQESMQPEEEVSSPAPSSASPLFNQEAILSLDLEKPLFSASIPSKSPLEEEDLPIPALFEEEAEIVSTPPILPQLPIAQASAAPSAAAPQNPPQVVDAGASNSRKRKKTGDVKQAVLSKEEAEKAVPLIPNKKLRKLLQEELKNPSKTAGELVNKHKITIRMLTYYLNEATASPIVTTILPHILKELSPHYTVVTKETKRQFTKTQFAEVMRAIVKIKNRGAQKALATIINDSKVNYHSLLKGKLKSDQSEFHRQRKKLIEKFPYLGHVLREKTSEKRKADEIEAPRVSSRRKK